MSQFHQQISYATRTLFNALINGNRGYQAPWTDDGKSLSVEAVAMLRKGGPKILSHDPATIIDIRVVPQAHDFVHAVGQLRMLPACSPESTSGGWVALSYAFDPPPDIPEIIIPQAQWNAFGGETRIDGLTTKPGVFGGPMPGMAYPGVIGTQDNVTSTGTL